MWDIYKKVWNNSSKPWTVKSSVNKHKNYENSLVFLKSLECHHNLDDSAYIDISKDKLGQLPCSKDFLGQRAFRIDL